MVVSSDFSTGFFDSKSASLAPFNLRKNSRANDERTNERDDLATSCERAIAKERRTKRYLYTIGLESFCCYGRFESTTTAVRARGANARRPAPKPKRTKQQFRAKADGKQRERSTDWKSCVVEGLHGCQADWDEIIPCLG